MYIPQQSQFYYFVLIPINQLFESRKMDVNTNQSICNIYIQLQVLWVGTFIANNVSTKVKSISAIRNSFSSLLMFMEIFASEEKINNFHEDSNFIGNGCYIK